MKPPQRPGSLFRAAATTYATNLAVAVLSLMNVLIVARTLGPAGRGDVAFLIAVAIITSQLASLSIQEANANLAGSEPRLRRGLGANSIVFSAVLGGAAAGVVAVAVTVAPALGGDVDRPLLWIALAVLPALVLRLYLSYLVQADYGFAVTNVAWLAGPATSFVANGALALIGVLTVTSAIVAWVAGQLLAVLILMVYVRRHTGLGRPDRPLARRSLGFGLKTHVGHFMQVGNYRVDQWFVGAVAGSRELGLYSVAVAWAEVLFYLPGILVLVQRPDLVRAEPAEAARRATKVLRGALCLAALVAVGLIVAAPLLCATVFGASFAGSVDDLRVLALGAFGIVTLELLKNALIAQRKPMVASAAVAVAFVATLALLVILVPEHGGVGAAIAKTTAYTVGAVAVAWIFMRKMHSPLAELFPPRPSDVSWMWRKLRSAL